MACGAEGPERWHGNAWNTRPIEDALRARIAALEAKCERMAKCIEAAHRMRVSIAVADSVPDEIKGQYDHAVLQLIRFNKAARAAVEEGSR